MILGPSKNTQAILLLTAPLILGRKAESSPILSLAEYNRLAKILRDNHRQPSDLIDEHSAEVLSFLAERFDKRRLEQLLARGFLLAQALERWATRSIWVTSRADAIYPMQLKSRLKEESPPILYGSGDLSVLEKGGLAVVGSRAVDDGLLKYSFDVGQLVAFAGRVLISGGARGVDRAAMDGASHGGGPVAAVLAEGLEQAVLAKGNRVMLSEGRLLLISPYDPAAGFNVGHAMQRNKLIYACSDAALVVNAELEKGGTWAGAVEQLDRFCLIPLFVRNGPNMTRGNEALLKRGGEPWPEPTDAETLNQLLDSARNGQRKESRQQLLVFSEHKNLAKSDTVMRRKDDPIDSRSSTPTVEATSVLPPAERVWTAVQEILREELRLPMTDRQVANLLRVTLPQARGWLQLLVEQGSVKRLTRPARYQSVNN